MRNLFVVLFLSAGLNAFADGVVTIEGKLTSDTPAKIALESDSRVYYVSKKSLSAEQLGALKAGKKLASLTVPFSAIERIEIKEKPAKAH